MNDFTLSLIKKPTVWEVESNLHISTSQVPRSFYCTMLSHESIPRLLIFDLHMYLCTRNATRLSYFERFRTGPIV